MSARKKPLKKYRHKQQIKPNRLRHVYKDRKGHILEIVQTKKNSYVGAIRRQYLYCPKCDRFFREIIEKVILVG